MNRIVESQKLADQIAKNPRDAILVEHTALRLREILDIESKNDSAAENLLLAIGGNLRDLLDILDDVNARKSESEKGDADG